MPIKPSNGDGLFAFADSSLPAITFGMETSRLATGGEGGEVIFPIRKGNKALQRRIIANESLEKKEFQDRIHPRIRS